MTRVAKCGNERALTYWVNIQIRAKTTNTKALKNRGRGE
jgi:hypothetical protein